MSRRAWLLVAALGGLFVQWAWWYINREPKWVLTDVSRWSR